MYMRIVQIKISPEQLSGFRKLYEDRIIPALRSLPGCLCANLLHSEADPEDYLSLTLWEKHEQAEAYESGLFQQLVNEARPFLSDSSEWKIELSENLELEYKPVTPEPVVKSYPVVAQTGDETGLAAANELMHMRVLSLKVQPEKRQEFQHLYRTKIIPALLKVQGCRYAYLLENLKEDHEFYSVTVWDSSEDAENYESSGLFNDLVEETKHTFSSLFQWKMHLEKDMQTTVVTSEDMKLSHYDFVTGQTFH